MIERWTQDELKATDNLTFAIRELEHRKKDLNPYAPLYTKLTETVATLTQIKNERDKYIEKISRIH